MHAVRNQSDDTLFRIDRIVSASETAIAREYSLPSDRHPNCRLRFAMAIFYRYRFGKYKRRIDSVADYTFETPAKALAFVRCPPRIAPRFFLPGVSNDEDLCDRIILEIEFSDTCIHSRLSISYFLSRARAQQNL